MRRLLAVILLAASPAFAQAKKLSDVACRLDGGAGCGGGSGSGTVTSVAISGGTTGFSFSGSPITTSGTFTLSGTLAVANGGTGNTSGTATINANLTGDVTSVGNATTIATTIPNAHTFSGAITMTAPPLLIGHTASVGRLGQALEVTTSANYGGVALNTYSAASFDNAPIIDLNRSKSSTKGTQTAVVSDDTLGFLTFNGSDGTAFRDGAFVKAIVNGAVTAGHVPADLIFYTSSTSAQSVERMRITSVGDLRLTAIAAPGTPVAGAGAVYVDSTSKNLAVKDDAGTVKHGVRSKAAVTSNFVTAIADDGTVTAAQPAASDITGITAAAQTVLDDATVGAMVDTLGGASASGTGGLVRTTDPGVVRPAVSGTPAAAGALGYVSANGTTTQYSGLTASVGSFPRVLAAGRPGTTITNSTTADQDFAAFFTIPANVLVANKILRITLVLQYDAGVSTATYTSWIKLGGTKVITTASANNPTDSATRCNLALVQIGGTAASGASVAVESSTTSQAVPLIGPNLTSQPVSGFATNGTLDVVFGAAWSATGSTEVIAFHSYIVEELN